VPAADSLSEAAPKFPVITRLPVALHLTRVSAGRVQPGPATKVALSTLIGEMSVVPDETS
jgi:hypothetical protein